MWHRLLQEGGHGPHGQVAAVHGDLVAADAELSALELLAATALAVTAEAEAAGSTGGIAGLQAQGEIQQQVLLRPGGEHPGKSWRWV